MKIGLTVIALLTLLGSTAPAQTVADDNWTGVTVLMDDGWRFREVSVALDSHGAGLWILRDDGAERLVSLESIDQILDADGEDVTRKVLDGVPAPSADRRGVVAEARPPRSQDPDETAWDGARPPAHPVAAAGTRRTTQQGSLLPFKVALSLEGGGGMPTGDWYESMTESYAVGARLRIATEGRSYIGIGVRYQDLGLDMPDYVLADDEVLEVDLSAHVMMYEVTFGVLSTPVRPGATFSYIELGAAYQTNVVEADAAGLNISVSEDSGAFLMRGGVLIPVGQAASLDIGASWAYKGLIFSDTNEADGSLIGLHLGLVWRN